MDYVELPEISGAFARGGNRLCFVDPRDPAFCVKVARPDRVAAIKRSEKSFPKNLKSLKAFDDNLQEYSVYKKIDQYIGEPAFNLIPRHKGLVDTNYGNGFVTEMIKDLDDRISISLKQYVWQFGVTPELSAALQTFVKSWSELGMPSRNLLLHNIVVEQGRTNADCGMRLVVIDGLGWPDLIPISYWFIGLAQKKASRKVGRLLSAIDD
ncbi:MAG: YrbL family protein, partial [bacterium]